MSDILSRTKVNGIELKLYATDQYNDYSVVYDHAIVVVYPTGEIQRFAVGTDKINAMGKFHEAIELVTRIGKDKEHDQAQISHRTEW